ncbi:MAG: hypothetical protein U0441_23285 [Polyangiaceae bacterium]
MRTFTSAAPSHSALCEARDTNPRLAESLWNAILGQGMTPQGGSYAEALQDTTPLQHLRRLLTDDVAAAYAFSEHWRTACALSGAATPFELREKARAAWEPFVCRASTADVFDEGFGLDASASWAHAREVETTGGDLAVLERIARLAGRMHATLCGARAKRVAGLPPEVHSVERGNDIARLLPSELVALGEPLLELVLMERLAGRKAAQYAVRGDMRADRGPLTIALDESGSMHGARNEWAKAAAVALTRVAWRERRNVAIVHYARSTVTHDLLPGRASLLLGVVRHFLSGGTDTALGISEGTRAFDALSKKSLGDGDLVLVTDGVDSAASAQATAIESLHQHGARLWTVAIECTVASDSPLRGKAAGYVRLGAPDLTDPASVLHLATAA